MPDFPLIDISRKHFETTNSYADLTPLTRFPTREGGFQSLSPLRGEVWRGVFFLFRRCLIPKSVSILHCFAINLTNDSDLCVFSWSLTKIHVCEGLVFIIEAICFTKSCNAHVFLQVMLGLLFLVVRPKMQLEKVFRGGYIQIQERSILPGFISSVG
jgi:hypothetical protein